MKKLCFIFFLFSVSISIKAGLRDLIILIDWRNERVSNTLSTSQPTYDPSQLSGFGPVTSSLVTALGQEAAPILVSSATWKNFVERKKIFDDFLSKTEQVLIKEYKGTYPRFNTDQGIQNFAQLCKQSVGGYSPQFSNFIQSNPAASRELNGFLIPYVTQVSTDNWILQKITPHWYLLVPKKYLGQIKKEKLPPAPDTIAKTTTDDELLLGLKSGTSIQNPLEVVGHDDGENVLFAEEFLTAIKSLFITINDVKDKYSKEQTEKNRAIYLHHWYFYLNGHGGPSGPNTIGIITGLRIPQFQTLLTFFDRKIITDFLFYSTCYAGGEHLKIPYIKDWFYPPLTKSRPKDIRKAHRAKAFNYIISAETLVYASTFGWLPSIAIPFKLGVDRVHFLQHFSPFFTGLHNYVYLPVINFKQWVKLKPQEKKKSYPNLAQILNNVTIFLDKNGKVDDRMQIPVMRYPNTAWFSVIDVQDKIFNLTRVLMEVRSAENRELVIKDKEAVVIHAGSPVTERSVDEKYHTEMLAPMVIKKQPQKKPPTFLSNSPRNAIHYFENIDARTCGLLELLQAFLPPIDEYYSRAFYIKKLICRNDNVSAKQNSALGMQANEGVELNNVIILYNGANPTDPKDRRKLDGIFFQHQLQSFRSFWEPHETNKVQRLKNNEFPGLQKIVEPNFIAPTYPQNFLDQQKQKVALIKNIVSVQEKKIQEQKEGKGFLRELSGDLNTLTLQLQNLNMQLKRLK